MREKLKLMSDFGIFSSYEGYKERRTGKIRGTFSKIHMALNGGCWVARRLHPLEASTTMNLGIFIFLIFLRMCGLEKLGLVGQN